MQFQTFAHRSKTHTIWCFCFCLFPWWSNGQTLLLSTLGAKICALYYVAARSYRRVSDFAIANSSHMGPYQDLGSWILVPRSWYQDLGTKILVPKINGEPERRSLSVCRGARGAAGPPPGGLGGWKPPSSAGGLGGSSPPGSVGGLGCGSPLVKTILWIT